MDKIRVPFTFEQIAKLISDLRSCTSQKMQFVLSLPPCYREMTFDNPHAELSEKMISSLLELLGPQLKEDVEYFLYEDSEHAKITVNGQDFDVSSLDLYLIYLRHCYSFAG